MAEVGWKGLSRNPIMEFSIYTSYPTATPTTGFNHIDTPINSTPSYYLTANLAPGASDSAEVVGPITFTAAEIGQV